MFVDTEFVPIERRRKPQKGCHVKTTEQILAEALEAVFEDWQTLTDIDFNEGNEDVIEIDRQVREALALAYKVRE